MTPTENDLQMFWMEMVIGTISMVEAAIAYAPELKEDELLMLEILEKWVSVIHRTTYQLEDSMHVSVSYPKMMVTAFKIPTGESNSRIRRGDDIWTLSVRDKNPESVGCSLVGLEGVTKQSMAG